MNIVTVNHAIIELKIEIRHRIYITYLRACMDLSDADGKCAKEVGRFFRRYGGMHDSFLEIAKSLDSSQLNISYVHLQTESGRSDSYTGMKVVIDSAITFIIYARAQGYRISYWDYSTDLEQENKTPSTPQEGVEFIRSEFEKKKNLGIAENRDFSWPDVSDDGMGFDLFG